jgi:hypothetical protein
MIEAEIETDLSPTYKHVRVRVQAQYKDMKTHKIWPRNENTTRNNQNKAK